MWYPGSEGGTATARLLLGTVSPTGHLTTTWPKQLSDTLWGYDETRPLYPGDTTGTHPERLSTTNPMLRWTEGIFVGYRFFDREGIAPLFPFGWGLTYSRFKYSRLAIRPRGHGLDVAFTIKNIGRTTAADVAQVYVGPAPSVPAGVQQADRALAGFDRISLRPGRAQRVTIHIGPGGDRNGSGNRRAFSYWSTDSQAWQTAPGRRTIWVGDADSASRLYLSGRGTPR
jgi:beta-glucosidase